MRVGEKAQIIGSEIGSGCIVDADGKLVHIQNPSRTVADIDDIYFDSCVEERESSARRECLGRLSHANA